MLNKKRIKRYFMVTIISLLFIFSGTKFANGEGFEIELDKGLKKISFPNYDYQLSEEKFMLDNNNFLLYIFPRKQLFKSEELEIGLISRDINLKRMNKHIDLRNEYLDNQSPFNRFSSNHREMDYIEETFGFFIEGNHDLYDKVLLSLNFEQNRGRTYYANGDDSYKESYHMLVEGLRAGLRYRYPFGEDGGLFKVNVGVGPYFINLDWERDIDYSEGEGSYLQGYYYKAHSLNYRLESSIETSFNSNYRFKFVNYYEALYFDRVVNQDGKYLFSVGDEDMEEVSFNFGDLGFKALFIISF